MERRFNLSRLRRAMKMPAAKDSEAKRGKVKGENYVD
jgi:hypothetical protein